MLPLCPTSAGWTEAVHDPEAMGCERHRRSPAASPPTPEVHVSATGPRWCSGRRRSWPGSPELLKRGMVASSRTRAGGRCRPAPQLVVQPVLRTRMCWRVSPVAAAAASAAPARSLAHARTRRHDGDVVLRQALEHEAGRDVARDRVGRDLPRPVGPLRDAVVVLVRPGAGRGRQVRPEPRAVQLAATRATARRRRGSSLRRCRRGWSRWSRSPGS